MITNLTFLFPALVFLPDDRKALFRRCHALECHGKLDEAFIDARRLSQILPKVQCNTCKPRIN